MEAVRKKTTRSPVRSQRVRDAPSASRPLFPPPPLSPVHRPCLPSSSPTRVHARHHHQQQHKAPKTAAILDMATPSSSTTSPSPALSYALPARSSASDSATSSATSDERDREQDLAEREERRRNLLARAEFAKVSSAPLFALPCVQRNRRDARCDTLGKTSCVYALGWEVVLLRRVCSIVLRDRARGA